jgi:hypothetical protein
MVLTDALKWNVTDCFEHVYIKSKSHKRYINAMYLHFMLQSSQELHFVQRKVCDIMYFYFVKLHFVQRKVCDKMYFYFVKLHFVQRKVCDTMYFYFVKLHFVQRKVCDIMYFYFVINISTASCWWYGYKGLFETIAVSVVWSYRTYTLPRTSLNDALMWWCDDDSPSSEMFWAQ